VPIFQLSDAPVFPPTRLADPSGLLAIGGDLSPERLVQAYAQGIFPWYSDGEPILWHAPSERMVLLMGQLRVNRSTRKALRKPDFEITIDTAFADVIDHCARAPRAGQAGTWISAEMQAAYTELHHHGVAHSVEVWRGAELVGGLYGVSLGRAFFGESMFSYASNASKAALVRLASLLDEWEFRFIDCQVHTPLLETLGAEEMSRDDFERLLHEALQAPTRQGRWQVG
jgi:leucyl/phenylalanyl-tRNA---protein transferase